MIYYYLFFDDLVSQSQSQNHLNYVYSFSFYQNSYKSKEVIALFKIIFVKDFKETETIIFNEGNYKGMLFQGQFIFYFGQKLPGPSFIQYFKIL